VVIGASIAGLLAASVLAEAFQQVTVFDRDTLPVEPGPRRGVPQSRHLHAMHARGAQALTELLPGFRDEMVAAGAVVGDTQADVHWYLDDYLLKPAHSGLEGIAMTRPKLEWLMRSRAGALPGVRITDATDVTGLVTSGGRVTGVTVRAARTPDATAETVAADLVIDAGGRGSRALAWLGELGYPLPQSSQVRADVTYLSRFYSRDPAQLDGRFGGLVTPYPGQPRGGAVLRQEGDRFIVLLAGMVGEEPPLDEAGMLAYADSLACPDIAAVMRQSTPLGEPVSFTYPSSTRHHYEALDAYLGGFLVTGDALCGLNPIYGQGITIAALEALTLRRLLGSGGAGAGASAGAGAGAVAGDLPKRYFREVGKLVGEAWATAASADLRFPQVEGKRQPGSKLINAYAEKYRAAASVDPVLGRTFLRVANMIDKPTRLLSPGHMLRVFRAAPSARKSVASRS
jgi:2-polyprenyl-6-methoxyphenol hydroxylase-like FAD-dependent oxidoreductase